MNNFGKEVRKAMIDADLKVCEFARSIGVTHGYACQVIAGMKKTPPSFYRHLVDKGLATIPVQVEYTMDRRAMDVAGLSRDQVAELVKMADGMRRAGK